MRGSSPRYALDRMATTKMPKTRLRSGPRIAADEKTVRDAFLSFLDAVRTNQPDVVKAAAIEGLKVRKDGWESVLAETMRKDYAFEPERLREIVDVKTRSDWAVATIRRPGAELEKYMLFGLLRRPDGRWGIIDFTNTSREDIEAFLNSYAGSYSEERRRLYAAPAAVPPKPKPEEKVGAGTIVGQGAGPASLNPQETRRAEALIAQFSAPEFAVRQKAVEDLVKMGPAVLPLVKKTLAETKDAEEKLRCDMVIKALGGKPEAAVPKDRNAGAKGRPSAPSTPPIVVEVTVLSGVVAFSFGSEAGQLTAGETRTFPAARIAAEETRPANQPVKEVEEVTALEAVPEPDEEKLTADELFMRGWNSKDRNEQVRLYTRVIELDPKRAAAWQNRGFAHFCLGKNDLALADYGKCLEIDPKNGYAYNNRGQILLARGQLDDALKDLNKAIECEPGLAYPYNHRGKLYTRQGKYDLAVESFSKAVELLGDRDDEWLLVHLGRAKAYYRLKDFDKAWADVKFCREKKIKVPDDFLHDLEDASGKFDGE